MEIKDYSQKLSDERQKFAEQNQKMRDVYSEEIDRSNKVHETQKEDLASKYRDGLNRVEKETSDTIEIHAKNARDALLKKESELTEKNRAQKEEFQRQNNGTRTEMNNRLGSLRESYDKTLLDSNKTNMTKIAEQKQKFGDEAQTLRNFYNTSINDTQKRSEQKASDLAKNYRQNVGRLEEDTRETLDQRNKVTKGTVAKLKDDHSKNLTEVRDNFLKDRNDIKREAMNKTTDAQQAYYDSVNEDKRQHKISLQNAEDSFERRLGGKDKEVDLMVENQKKNGQKFNNYMAEENNRVRKMTLDNQKEKNQLITQGLQDRDTTVKKLQGQVEETKKAYQSEAEVMKELQDQSKRLSSASSNERLQETEQKYQKVINDMGEKDQVKTQRTALDQSLGLEEVKREFNDDRKDFRHKLTEMSDNSAYREEINKADMNRLKDQFDRAMQDKKVQLDQDRFERQASERLAQNDFKNLLKDKDVKRTMSGQRREKEFHDFMLEKEVDFNKQKTSLTDNYEKQAKASQEDNATQARLQDEAFKRRMDNQNGEYAKTTKIVAEKNNDNLTDLQKEYSKEKTDFIEKSRREMYDLSLGQKEQHQKTVEATTDSYEKRLNSKDKEIQRMQEFYENKLAVFQKNSQEELAALKKNSFQASEGDKRATKDLLASREKEYTKRLEAMRSDFEMGMARMASNNDIKVAKITQRYEDMISRMQAEHKAATDLLTRQSKDEYEKLLTSSQERQESMKNQYELKIEKLRLANVSEEAKKEIRQQEMNKA